jgi:hypothetical protein
MGAHGRLQNLEPLHTPQLRMALRCRTDDEVHMALVEAGQDATAGGRDDSCGRPAQSLEK